MARTLQGELQRANLVAATPNGQVSYLEQKLNSYPKNRLDKPVIWAKWLVRKRIPKHTGRRCAFCGCTVRKNRRDELIYNQAIEQEIREEFEKNGQEIGSVRICKRCSDA